jgi:hypothetical protein
VHYEAGTMTTVCLPVPIIAAVYAIPKFSTIYRVFKKELHNFESL